MKYLKPNQEPRKNTSFEKQNSPRNYLIFLFILILAACSAPKITSFYPEHGTPGTEVTIRGKQMIKSNDLSQTRVELNGVIQPNVTGTSTELTFTVQEGANTGKIKVVAAGKSSTSSEYFDVVDNSTDPTDEFTFGGLEVQAAKVSPSGTNQEILFGLMRTKWAPNSGGFNNFDTDVDNEFNEMNEFWKEASYGKASFTKSYLTNSIIDLPNSKEYYYHRAQQRSLLGSFVDNNITFPDPKQLTVAYNAGTFQVNFPAANLTRVAIVDSVNNAMARITGGVPTFVFEINGDQFRFRSTLNGKREERLELRGSAVPYLGFGSQNLFDLPANQSRRIFFSTALDESNINFPNAVALEITTLGETTQVNFVAGSTLNMNQIVAQIQAAYPGENRQQPFVVEQMVDPRDATKRLLIIKTIVEGNGDLGMEMTIGGTAAPILGLDAPGMLLKYEPETFRGSMAISDGFNAHASSLPAGTRMTDVFGNARMFVSVLVDDSQLRAHYSSNTFNIGGTNFEVSYFASRFTDLGPFAHETGHALGLPDLYDVTGTRQGQVPNNWDIMDCSRCDVHPVQWLKARRHKEEDKRGETWTSGARIPSVSPPTGSNSKTVEYILSPAESPWISRNPFSVSHPGIQVVHAVELVPTDPKDVFFLENRQPGVYQADHLGSTVNFSTGMPGEGVIMYQARRISTSNLIEFLPVSIVSPYANPLNALNETYEHRITNLNKITVEVLDKIQNPDASGGPQSFSYHIRITWGQGSFYDLAIKEWNPRPWESEDIWVDNRAQNDWGVYTYANDAGEPRLNGDNVAVNMPNRLHARIRNLGDIDVTQDFDVIWRIAVPQQAGGPIETEIGRVRVTEDVLGNSSIITPPLEWTPRSSSEEHICIKAEIVSIPGELNETANNMAQENLTQWFSGASSPFEPITVEFETKNPYDYKSEIFRISVPDVPAGWTVTVEDVEFELGPSEVKRQTATIRPIHGHFHSTGKIKENEGIIPELEVNIEAKMPIGDVWQTFGGVTAIVHPVNNNSTVSLRKENKTQNDGSVEVLGQLESRGVLSPDLRNRKIQVRIQKESDAEDQVWLQTETTVDASFSILIPAEYLQERVKVQAFHSGGKGFKPASSNEIFLGQ